MSQVRLRGSPDGTDSQADSVAKPVATGTFCRPVRADAGLAARSWIGAIGPDTRWCRDSSCVKYVRNPGAPAAFALVMALRGRVCKAAPIIATAWSSGSNPLPQLPGDRLRSAVQCLATVSFIVSFSYVRHRPHQYS